MNKQEFIDAVSDKTGISKKDCNEVMEACYEVIVEALKQGDDVTITGIGKWETRVREEREGKNPRTGEVITIPACKAPSFKAGKKFKTDIQ